MTIVHVARIPLTYDSGMGRISSMWRDAFVEAGHQFHHIGGEEVNKNVHVNLWGWHARKYLDKLSLQPDIVLVHEPLSGFFISTTFKTITFSHGIEERAWAVQTKYGFHKLSFKSKLFPIWLRFYSNTKGLKRANLLLISNETDKAYLINKGIDVQKIRIFKNGYYKFDVHSKINDAPVFLFNASWIERKGIQLLITAFNKVLAKHKHAKLIVAGTGNTKEFIINSFTENVREQITSVPRFDAEGEIDLYTEANVFVMPSYFEGQSLALTQAMAMGLCPIAADNCGQKDFIQNEANGLLFMTGDADDFVCKLENIIEYPAKIGMFGKAAQKSVEHLTWANVKNVFVEQCMEVLS